MDELLELSYKKPYNHPYPIGSSVVFSVLDIREVIGHIGKKMVYLKHKDGTELLYDIKNLKNRTTIRKK
jgi:hypothetical protein